MNSPVLNSDEQIVGESGEIYSLGESIGRGGTAEVFRITRLRDRSEFAAKMLSGHRFTVSPAMRERFRREMQDLAAVEHKNVLRFVDSGALRREPVLITEIAEQSLHGSGCATAASVRRTSRCARTQSWSTMHVAATGQP